MNRFALAVDPGSVSHGCVIVNLDNKAIQYYNDATTTKELFSLVTRWRYQYIIIEDIDTVHGTIGLTTVETARNIGRIEQHFLDLKYTVNFVGRAVIKKSFGAKNDKEMSAYIRMKWPFNIHNVKSHALQALALIQYYESI